jgi:hypothetical protein
MRNVSAYGLGADLIDFERAVMNITTSIDYKGRELGSYGEAMHLKPIYSTSLIYHFLLLSPKTD